MSNRWLLALVGGCLVASCSGGLESGGGQSSGTDAGMADGTAETSASGSGSSSSSGGTSSGGSSGGGSSSSGGTPNPGPAGPTPPSCAPGGPGMTDCGGAQDSCCTSYEVPGGTFYRTYWSYGTQGPVTPADPATVSGFRLDKYEVTVGRFRQFVGAVYPAGGGGGWQPAAGSGKHTHLNGGQGVRNGDSDGGPAFEQGWLASDDANVAPTETNLGTSCLQGGDVDWTPMPSGHEDLPMGCVNWAEAYAFCIWDGGFLPTKAEWEIAAAGGSQQREYPWGSADPSTTNLYAIYECNYPNGPNPYGPPDSAQGCTAAPVGTARLGRGLWGQLDLVGNVQEWVLDSEGATAGIDLADPCIDCGIVTPGPGRWNVGDAFGGINDIFPSSGREGDGADFREVSTGFRCARTP